VARGRCHVVHTLLRDPRVWRCVDDVPPSFASVHRFPWQDPPLAPSVRASAPALLKQAAWERRAHVVMAVLRRRARAAPQPHQRVPARAGASPIDPRLGRNAAGSRIVAPIETPVIFDI